VGALGTTREFLEAVIEELRTWEHLPHLEVETYTWSVLPEGERPQDDEGLIAGIAEELRWVQERVA
jgi:hypothetical protein